MASLKSAALGFNTFRLALTASKADNARSAMVRTEPGRPVMRSRIVSEGDLIFVFMLSFFLLWLELGAFGFSETVGRWPQDAATTSRVFAIVRHGQQC